MNNFTNMLEKLSEKLKQVQISLVDRGISLAKLEKLSTETKKAFDNAIESVARIKLSDLKKDIENRREQLKKWRISVWHSIFPINWKYVFSMPFIYGLALPMALFHLFLEIYHQVCFRLYQIPLVNRQEFFIYDRQLLPYLNWLEKINCFYCSYANNLFRYAVEIGGRTERYWCPIKYHRRINNAHSQYDKFVDYLDAENFRDEWKKLRNFSDINQDK